MPELASGLTCRFRWDGHGWNAKAWAFIAKQCVTSCGGHNLYALFVDGGPGEHWTSRPLESKCSQCGNIVGLTDDMLSEIFNTFDEWAEPQIARKRRKEERERQLVDRLWDLLGEAQPDTGIREALSDYRFDLLKLFYGKARGDEKLFAEFVSGDWEHAVLFNDYYAERKPWCTVGFIASVHYHLGNSKDRAKFVKAWKRHSRFRRGRLNFMAVDSWFYRAHYAMVFPETEYILGQLSYWNEYEPGKEFRIIVSKKRGRFNDQYRLETRRTSPRR